jgi:hypothetical protein
MSEWVSRDSTPLWVFVVVVATAVPPFVELMAMTATKG